MVASRTVVSIGTLDIARCGERESQRRTAGPFIMLPRQPVYRI